MKTILTVGVIFLLSLYNTYAQWVHNPLNKGTYISNIFFNIQNPKTVYASDLGAYKFFISYDGGTTWDTTRKFLGATIGCGALKALAQCPTDTNIMIGAFSECADNIIRTTDGGKTWVSVLQYWHVNSESFAFHPQKPNMVFGGVNDVGQVMGDIGYIIRSKDYGVTWDTVANLRQKFDMKFTCGMDINPETGHIFLGGHGGKIVRSTDYGDTWELVLKHDTGYYDNKVPIIKFSRKQPSIGFATFRAERAYRPRGGVWKTIDYGATWSRLPGFDSMSMWAMDVIDVDNHIEVACCNYSQYFVNTDIWYSKNAGDSWDKLQRNKFTDFQVEDSSIIMVETIKLTPRIPYYKNNLLFSSSLPLGSYTYDPTLTSVDDRSTKVDQTHPCYIFNNILVIREPDNISTIRLFDITGREVWNTKNLEGNIRSTEYPLTLNTGMYVCVITTTEGKTNSIVLPKY